MPKPSTKLAPIASGAHGWPVGLAADTCSARALMEDVPLARAGSNRAAGRAAQKAMLGHLKIKQDPMSPWGVGPKLMDG